LTGWQKGDIIYCDFLKTWHFTANCSWHSRPLLQVSGVATDELLSLVKTKNYRIFDLITLVKIQGEKKWLDQHGSRSILK